MKCFECGKGRIRRRTTVVRAELRGVKLEVPGIADECDRCGFQVVPLEHADEFGKAMDAAFRKAAGLLSKEQIRAARESLNMSQREFADYLGVGEASIKRWELGALQDRSSDNLIRQMTDPEFAKQNLERLCRRLGRRSPTDQQVNHAYVTGFQQPFATSQPVSPGYANLAWSVGYPKARVLN